MAPSSPECPSLPAISAEIEPLDRLARFSWDWAPLLCDSEHGCCNYHRCWSSIRLFQKAGALPAGADFFYQHLSGLVKLGKKRVLISGAADTGLMALVYKVFMTLDAVPEIVLVDRCLTTVMQNRLLAGSLGLEADIWQTDVRALECDPVDAVIVHSFLGFFPEAARQQVIDAWGRVLNPGGKVLMSTMLAENDNVPYPPKDEASIVASKTQLLENAMRAGMTRKEAGQLGDIAVEMLTKRLSHDPLITRDFLFQAFSGAGIELAEVTLRNKEHLGPLAAFRLQSERIQRAEVVGIRKQPSTI